LRSDPPGQKNGFHTVLLVSDAPDFPLIEKLESFDIIQIPELISPFFMFSEKQRNDIIELIISKLFLLERDLLIESHTLSISIWGELLAEKLQCKHIIYPLNERPLIYWEFLPVKDFFLWKLNRIELIGPSESSLKVVLGEFYSPDKTYYANIGFDPDELPEKSSPDISDLFINDYFTIGSISRLSKPYIEELIRSVIGLSDKYPDRRIMLIIAGDDPDPSILEKLKMRYNSKGNLKFVFPGYINKLGKDFFNNLDVFVGMATAAINSISSHCATITVDPITKKSSGFFGLTSRDTMFAEKNLLFPILYWIEKALKNPTMLKDSREAGYKLFTNEYLNDACMKRIEDLIAVSDTTKVYWNFPDRYLSSRGLRIHNRVENSGFYKLLQRIYGLRKMF
jgi:hypothetical protein